MITIDWQVIAQYDHDRLISNDSDMIRLKWYDNDRLTSIWLTRDRLTSDSEIWSR